MIDVSDLQIETEIARLFDHTCNDYAAGTLRQLLSTLPADVDEIKYRQQILKGFIAQDAILERLPYSHVDMREVCEFLAGLQRRADASGTDTSHRLRMRLALTVSRAEKQRFSARINQCIGLLYRLNTYYFEPLITAHFPPAFRQLAERISDFMKFVRPHQYETVAREGKLNISQLVQITTTLEAAASSGILRTFRDDLFLFEAYLSAAKGIVRSGFTFPEFAAHGITLEGFYHPLIKEPIKNDLQTKGNVVLLTGPNMAGKSTVLKAVSLCVYLAHAGFAVPAAVCKLPFFSAISISVNSGDDIKNGYSHFLTEVKTLKRAVLCAQQGLHCFAVFDELFKGTNSEDAAAITETTITGLLKWPDSLFFISTHLHQLKSIIMQFQHRIDCYFVECSVVEQHPVFTYRLQKGWSDLKVGRLLFNSEGLDKLLS